MGVLKLLARRLIVALLTSPSFSTACHDSPRRSRSCREAARTTAKYDLPGPWLKEAVAEAAEELGTSASQFAAFLLAWGMRMYMRRDAALMEQIAQHRRWTRSLRFEYDLDVPRDVKDEIVQVIEVW